MKVWNIVFIGYVIIGKRGAFKWYDLLFPNNRVGREDESYRNSPLYWALNTKNPD